MKKEAMKSSVSNCADQAKKTAITFDITIDFVRGFQEWAHTCGSGLAEVALGDFWKGVDGSSA